MVTVTIKKYHGGTYIYDPKWSLNKISKFIINFSKYILPSTCFYSPECQIKVCFWNAAVETHKRKWGSGTVYSLLRHKAMDW